MHNILNINQAKNYLVELSRNRARANPEPNRQALFSRFLDALGNPQNSKKAIHVTATSGKSTICYLIDGILRTNTINTGLIQSPHVYDIRERIQVNGQMISEKKFIRILIYILQMSSQTGIDLSYSEILTAIGLVNVADSNARYMIIESIKLGEKDITNTINRTDKLSVVGQIGVDSDTDLNRSFQIKAKIVAPNSSAIVLRQNPAVNKSLEDTLRDLKCQAIWADSGEDYQESNDNVAITACEYLAKRDGWHYQPGLSKNVMDNIFIPGRYEKRFSNNHTIILDGAHNPQKIEALTNRLRSESRENLTFIVSFDPGKYVMSCLELIKPHCQNLAATEFYTSRVDSMIPRRPMPRAELEAIAKKVGFNQIKSFPTPKSALIWAIKQSSDIVATGSFFMLADIDQAM